MKETLSAHLVKLAEQFKDDTGVSPATVAKRALNDNTFFTRLGAGKGFTVGTYDRLVSWFYENWPVNTPWPDEIARPTTSDVEATAGEAA